VLFQVLNVSRKGFRHDSFGYGVGKMLLQAGGDPEQIDDGSDALAAPLGSGKALKEESY
jgi:hypothetical protein